jgi:hypothetical protein
LQSETRKNEFSDFIRKYSDKDAAKNMINIKKIKNENEKVAKSINKKKKK